jgi:hypothetical protein
MAKSWGRQLAFIDGLGAGDDISSAKLIRGIRSMMITATRATMMAIFRSNFIYKYSGI